MSGARGVAVLLIALLAAPAWAEKKPLGPGERVDLNRASVADLMRIPGVGRRRAEAIVAYRARHPFRRPEEITRVKGVSDGWFAKARPHLAAGASPAPARTALVSATPRR